MLAFLTVGRVVEAALGALLREVLARPAELVDLLRKDPDAVLRFALAKAFATTGIKLSPRDAATAIGRIVLQARLEELKGAADELVANMTRLKAKHAWLR